MIEICRDGKYSISIPNDNIAGIYLDENKNEKGKYIIVISCKYPLYLSDDTDDINGALTMHFDDLKEATDQFKEFKKIIKLSE